MLSTQSAQPAMLSCRWRASTRIPRTNEAMGNTTLNNALRFERTLFEDMRTIIREVTRNARVILLEETAYEQALYRFP